MDRLIGFSGAKATILKFIILAVIDFFGGLAIVSAFGVGSLPIAIALILILIFLNVVYFLRTPAQMKFLAPGIVFLITFVLVPIVYTIAMSGFKFSTGNEISKADAIEQLIARSVTEDSEGTAFDITLGELEGGEPAMIMLNQIDGSVTIASDNGIIPLEEGTYETNEWGVPVSADGFSPWTPDEVAEAGDAITEYRFPVGDGSYVTPLFPELAILLTQDLTYDEATDTLISKSTGRTFVDNGKGNFVREDKPSKVLYPGWRALNFPDNFTGLIFDPELRGPFLQVFVWTVAFAFLSVLTTFAVGLTLAIALDKPFWGRRIYRSILILPYAIPGFLSILIWRGMFERDFGIINRVLVDVGLIESNVAWFDEPWLARGVVILVNLWLGFPYMYLISSGALQAIPQELTEAAAIDGATAWQSFRMVTLPLLLQVLFPLLIASFAFNFNNFNMIYLLTGGGPKDELAGERAGATDILISYAYNTAIANPLDQNFGLASAISLFMFIIVGVLSMWSLRRSKALEEF